MNVFNYSRIEVPLDSPVIKPDEGYIILPQELNPIVDKNNVSATVKTDVAGQSHVLVSVLVPLGCLFLIAAFTFLVIFILKKSRLDKLRHHLMPLYNFDPAEEDGDWESELLEEDKEQQVALHIQSPSPSADSNVVLKFSSENIEL